jgi:HD-GYP domain-containing protein (c-di-GMP phosphodiesterase class II)
VTEASDQLAIALNQETLRDQTRRRVHELTALHDIALLLNYQHSAVDPLGELTERIAHLIGARRCLLVLRSDDDHYEGYYPAFGFSQEEVAMIRWQPVQEERSFSLWTRGYAIANQAEDLENAPRGLFVRLHAENLLAISLWKEERILGILVAIDKPGGYHPEDYQLLSVVASQAAQLIINTRLFNELSNAYDATIKGWSKALELRERETQNHSERVTSLARKLAQRLKLEETELEDFSRGVLLHDIGKMGIPDDILLKAGPLEPDQWAIMRQHPGMAYNLLKNISFLHKALDVPYCHHERWDGSGYPRGLKGEEIPITARLFAVVDVWDALTNDRVYRRAWSDAETAAYLRQNAGILFDPKVVEEFLKMMEG